MKDIYTKKFFGILTDTSTPSAQKIVPLALDFCNAKSVLDVGSGSGSWLKTYLENGVKDIYGLDGDWVNVNDLEFPQEHFSIQNLDQPFSLGRKFDLVNSLEVAEHLKSASAKTFVESLTAHGDIILFSAAIPFQEGYNHINEQWQDYWVDLFKGRGFLPVDNLRKKIWHMEDVSPWYKQNILFFIKEEVLKSNEKYAKAYEETRSESYSLVHPFYYLKKIEKLSDLDNYKASDLIDSLRKRFKSRLGL